MVLKRNESIRGLQGMTIRTLLVLGRVSNLPTVWSNVLCAWLLCNSGDWLSFVVISIGVSCIYIGGMYLNDACDAAFDEKCNPERPIPSGQISKKAVFMLSVGWLLLGFISLMTLMNPQLAVWGGLLVGLVVLYNVLHKKTSWTLLVMGGCRFVLYPLVGSTVGMAMSSELMLAGLGMFLYIIGLSSAARSAYESNQLKSLSVVPIFLSILLVIINDTRGYDLMYIGVGILLCLWLIRSFAFLFWMKEPDIGRSVESFLAGIVLLDLFKVNSLLDDKMSSFGIFIGLFLSSILAQRKIPAN